jgi:hypothetical protein
MREVVTPNGSRFLLCQLSHTNADYPKYPAQPVVRCQGHQAEAVNQIALALKQFLADSSPDPMSLRKIAAEIQALPLVLDMGGCFAIRCNGDIVSFSWDTPCDVRIEEDPRIRNRALFQGSKKYASLQCLVPPRPADAPKCPHCHGTGRLPEPMQNVICYRSRPPLNPALHLSAALATMAAASRSCQLRFVNEMS